MKAVVTGGSGFIGSCLVKKLVDQLGWNVLNIDKLTYAANKELPLWLKNKQNYHFLESDICNEKNIYGAIQAFQPNVVFHLAAESHVDNSIAHADPFIQTNIIGTASILKVVLDLMKKDALNSQFRLIHISTDEVYGSLEKEGPLVIEGEPYKPNSPYSASKASSDLLIRAWNKTHQVPAIITHCTNNYGPYQHDEKLLPTIIRHALANSSIPIYGKGNNIRDWLYVEDHCDALIAIFNEGQIGETYNISALSEVTNLDMANSICEILDELSPREDFKSYKDQISFVKDRPGHDYRYALDNTKILKSTSWKPKVELSQGLKETVKWFLEKYHERNYSSRGTRHTSLSSH